MHAGGWEELAPDSGREIQQRCKWAERKDANLTFVHPFNACLLSAYYMPDMVLGAETWENMTR